MRSFVDGFAEFGERPALVFPNRPAISFAELARRTSALAAKFAARKMLIAVEACADEHAVVAYLAALKGRHTVALIPSQNIDALGEFESAFRPDITCRRLDGRWRITHGSGSAMALHPDLALLLRTSGSTGKARYVRLSALALNSNARSIGKFLGLASDDCGALTLPFHYSYGLSVLNSHLAAGGSVYFPSNGAGDGGFADEVRRVGCTNISGVPYSYELFEKAGFRQNSLPTLRFMTVAGGRIAPELAETYRRHLDGSGKRFFVMYGQTEATARIAYVPPDRLAGNTDCIGIAIPGGSLRIVDEDGRSVKAGETGELAYRGPNVMMGYADATGDLARGHEVEELLTGDLATCERDGLCRIVGRTKRISKIAGLRISHDAVEAALGRIGVASAVVGDDMRLVAFVASDRDEHEILCAAKEASGLSALHISVRRADALPRLLSGKIDYAHLNSLMQKEVADNSDADIVQGFRRALYPRQVTLTDTFEQLGGDSLIYVQLSLVLDRRLGQAPLDWERMPLSQLAGLGRSTDPAPTIDTDLLVRALAITTVVVHHATLWPIPGGAATLVVLVGFGLARFHSSRLFAGDVARLFRTLATNLAVYAPIVAGYALASGQVPWASVFLVGNLGLAPPDRMLPYLYWFVEAYAQILLIFAGLFSVQPIRRFAAGRPFIFGLGLLAVAMPAKFLVPLVWNVGPTRIFTVPDFLYLVAFGWCIHFARHSSDRMLLSVLVVATCPLMAYTGGNWTGSWVKYTAVLLAALLLIYMPRIRVPRIVSQLALPVSAASYHIYLFHRILPEMFLPQPDVDLSNPISAAIAVVSGVFVGMAVYAAQRKAMLWLDRRRSDSPSAFVRLDASRV